MDEHQMHDSTSNPVETMRQTMLDRDPHPRSMATIPLPEQVTAAAYWLTVCGRRREYPQGTPLAEIEAAINEILAADGRPELRAKMVRKLPDRYHLEIADSRRTPTVTELNAILEHATMPILPSPTAPWWDSAEDAKPRPGIKGVSYPPSGKGKRAQRRMSKPRAARKQR